MAPIGPQMMAHTTRHTMTTIYIAPTARLYGMQMEGVSEHLGLHKVLQDEVHDLGEMHRPDPRWEAKSKA